MIALRLVADDLTGALDSAAQFTGALGPLPVRLDPKGPWPDGSFALNLSCRDAGERDAVGASEAAMPALVGAATAFKKIDSLLRGHWAAEIAAIARRGSFRTIVLAPAFPAQGRITRGGRQFVAARDGSVRPLGIDLADTLSARGVPVLSGRSALSDAARSDSPVRIVDAASDADLHHIATAGRRMPGPVLWCGSAGLARALAGTPPSAAPVGEGPYLVVVGTNHAVSTAQVEQALVAANGILVRFGADTASAVDGIAAALERHGCCIAVPDLKPGLTAIAAAPLISAYLCQLLPLLRPPARLAVVGGETLAAVCRSLQVDGLAVLGERDPGVPVFRLDGGLWAGTTGLSKSGAFGEADWLARQLTGPKASGH